MFGFQFSIALSARERDNAVADELDAMEKNCILPKRWNGPMEREHLSAQRHSWNHAKKRTRDDQISQFQALYTEVERISAQIKESVATSKTLEEEIKSLRSNPAVASDSHEKIKKLQNQITVEKQERRDLRARKVQVKSSINELRETSLSGVRLNGRRPSTLPLVASNNNDETLRPGSEKPSEVIGMISLRPSLEYN
jgi:chromosome segregation ATPase